MSEEDEDIWLFSQLVNNQLEIRDMDQHLINQINFQPAIHKTLTIRRLRPIQLDKFQNYNVCPYLILKNDELKL